MPLLIVENDSQLAGPTSHTFQVAISFRQQLHRDMFEHFPGYVDHTTVKTIQESDIRSILRTQNCPPCRAFPSPKELICPLTLLAYGR